MMFGMFSHPPFHHREEVIPMSPKNLTIACIIAFALAYALVYWL